MISSTLKRGVRGGKLPLWQSTIHSGNSGRCFVYASNGDSNGLFTYYGTNFGTQAWANPFQGIDAHAGHAAVNNQQLGMLPFDVPGGADLLTSIVNHDVSHYSTGGSSAGNYIQFDLGIGRSLIVTDWLYRYRDDAGTFSPTSLKLQGSNNASSWTDLQTIAGLTPSANTWVHSTTSGIVTAYRYFRYTQVGTNNSGANHLSIGEAELYGWFFSTNPNEFLY
jgi:hypothetical protein